MANIRSLMLSVSALFVAAAAAQAQQAVEVPRLDMAKRGQMVPADDPYAWKMKKASWSAQDEAEFAAFIQRIGSAVESGRCKKVDECMKSSANPFRSSDPKDFKYYSDCADWPYYARGYFAWKKGLPFTFVSATRLRDPNDPKKDDDRYARAGNKPARRTDTVATSDRLFPSAKHVLGKNLIDVVSSATLRMPIIPQPGEALSDFYAIPVNRTELRTGTALYSGDGHVAIVYKIEPNGVIKLVDAHPDNSLTLNEYGPRFQRSRAVHGSIFKNFRPIELVGARPDSEGNLIGGKIVIRGDNEIPGASYEQAELNFPTTSDYFLWVRQKMSAVALKIDVVEDFKSSLKNLCNLVAQRQDAVDESLRDGIDQKRPDTLPKNIFGAQGEWEKYSTPGRDVSLRINYKSTLDTLKYNVNALLAHKEGFSYNGNNLAQDLYDSYRTIAKSCPIGYMSNAGGPRKLDLEQIRLRLFKISFDPYDCVDLRWGDDTTGKQVCGEDMRWYNAEQYLRNLTSRQTEDFHGFDLLGLEKENTLKEVPFVWDTDIIAYLNKLASVSTPLR